MRTVSLSLPICLLASWLSSLITSTPNAMAQGQIDARAKFLANRTTLLRMVPTKKIYEAFELDGPGGPFYLRDCGSLAHVELGIGEEKVINSAALTWYLRNKLEAVSGMVGRNLVAQASPVIADIEQEAIDELSSAAADDAFDQVLETAKAALNRIVAQNGVQSAFPRGFEISPGCGAGDIGYKLEPSDKRARLFIIKSFYFEVCKVLGKSAYDLDQCDGWEETTGRNFLSGAGTYVYQAFWPDNSSTHGTFRITDTILSEIDQRQRPEVVKVVIQKGGP